MQVAVARTLGVDAGGAVKQTCARRAEAEGLFGVADRLTVAALAGPDEAPAAVSVGVLRVELNGQLEVAQGQLGGVANQMGPPAVGLHGRGRVQLQRPREIFDGAGMLPQLRPRQAPAAVDRLQRLALLQVAVECLDGLLEPAQLEQALRAQALRPRMVLAQPQ